MKSRKSVCIIGLGYVGLPTAYLCLEGGLDIVETIDCASTKPYAFIPHYLGCGVGGRCIPIDPYYLIHLRKWI